MALLNCSRVFFELRRCWIQLSWQVYPRLGMWQRALEERFTCPLPVSKIISRHTPTWPNCVCPRHDDSTRFIHLMKHVVLLFKDPHGIIGPMIVTMQKWFTIFNLLIQVCQYFAVQLLREGYASSRLWFHTFQISLQYTISSITFTTIMIYRQT